MYRFNKNGVSVLIVIDKRRQKNNGLYPVKIEVVHKRRQRYYPTGQDVTVEEWETMWTSRRKHDKLANIEKSYNQTRCTAENLIDKGQFCFAALDRRMGKRATTVNEAVVQRMRSLHEEGRINSYYRYRSMLHAIEASKGVGITFEDIDAHWLKRCEAKWFKDGKNSTTINIYMKTLRSILYEAIENGIINEDQCPFKRGNYRIPASKKRSLALTKEQIEKIIKWNGNKDACYWRDLWVFSYLCNGINFRDMLYLKYGDICDGEISFVRSKTAHCGSSKIIKAAVTPLMEDIMERSGNGRMGPAKSMIFKHAKGNEDATRTVHLVRAAIMSCNKALRIISEDLGIPHFTTYSARHSFATVLHKSGIGLQYISESLGHASLKMTENYLAGFNKEDRKRNACILTDFT